MSRYKATRQYGNSRFFVNAGDVVEMDDAEAARLEADSPGTFEKADDAKAAAFAPGGEVDAEDVLTEHGAAVKDEIEAQIPTADIDPEDKAREIPGEGNKYTPASGYNVPDASGVRVVERAPRDRQVKGAATRAEEAATLPGDTSAQARVTDATPASLAADDKQLDGGVTAWDGEGDATAEDRAEASKRASDAAAARAAADAEAAKPTGMTRDELNAYAAARGIDDPESYPNKDALIAAIEARKD